MTVTIHWIEFDAAIYIYSEIFVGAVQKKRLSAVFSYLK